MENAPIFDITPNMLNLIIGIGAKLGEIDAVRPEHMSPRLRKENRIRTIHSSLAIENNSLTLGQVTAILDGKRVLGNPVEVKEVQNAAAAYDLMFELDPMKVDDLLKAHRLLMNGLIRENGRFRNGGVGIFDGGRVVHIAPPAKFVPGLIGDLFEWYRTSDFPPLIKSAAFHYEFEFIHPFADGNGRMGRMWHTLLLGQWNEVFFWLPIEELIKERQQEYYDALGKSDATANSTRFIEVMLRIILDSLRALDLSVEK
nr:MAG TPA: Fic family protein [Bacteriophage sp.]